MKRTISLILISVLCFTWTIPCFSAEDAIATNTEIAIGKVETKATSILKKLEILDDNYSSSSNLTRSKFVKMVSNIFKQDTTDYTTQKCFDDVNAATPNANAINKAAQYGLLSWGEGIKFNGDDQISHSEVCTILSRLLGYEMMAKQKGGYPDGYVNVALSIGLNKGISSDMPQNEIYITMLYNALFTPIVETNYGVPPKYEISKNKTILSDVLEISEIKGTLNAVGQNSLSKSFAVRDNELCINNQKFYYDEKDKKEFVELIGSDVTGYFKEDKDGDYNIEFCIENRNATKLTISLDKIISFTAEGISYYDEEDDKQEEAIAQAPYIIYNNRPVNSVPALGKSGYVKLISYGSDFDRIIIKDYDNYVVKNVSETYLIISDRYGLKEIELEEYDEYSLLDGKGNDISLSSISNWNVLSVAISEDETCVEIIQSVSSESGTIQEISNGSLTSFMLKLNDKSYYVTEECYNYLLSNPLKPGDSATFYLNIEGKIAGVELQINDNLKIGYLIKMCMPNSLGGMPKARILTDSGEISDVIVVTSGDKIKVNNAKINAETFINNNTNLSGAFNRQVIRYTSNDVGNILSIETVDPNNDGTKDGLYKTFSGNTGNYYNTTRTFDAKIMLSATPIIFVVPPDTMADLIDLYYVKPISYFESFKTYQNIETYSSIPNSLTSNIVVKTEKESDSLSSYDGVAVVQKIFKVINDDGEETYRLVGLSGTKEIVLDAEEGVNITKTNLDPSSVVNPKPNQPDMYSVENGDVIRYCLTQDNKIKCIQLIYDYSEDNYLPSSNYLMDSSQRFKAGIGEALRFNEGIIEFQYTYKNGTEIEYYPLDKAKIIVCDSSAPNDSMLRWGSMLDIKDSESYSNPSTIFIYSVYSVPTTVIVYN